MKIRIYALLVMVLSIMCANNTYAGFVFKKQPATADSTTIHERGQSFVFSEKATVYQNVKNYVSSKENLRNAPGNDGSGWEGIVSLVCGILSLCISFFGPSALLLALCAVVFGALGMGRRKRHRGLAIAGFVIGVVVLTFALLTILLLFTLFAW